MQGGQDLSEMLNKMKIIEFRGQQEERIVGRVFGALRQKREVVGLRHYQMSLYFKVFKGLMMSRLQLEDFAERLQNVYIAILLQKHFFAIKQFKLKVQEERRDKIVKMRDQAKRKGLRQFVGTMRAEIEKKRVEKVLADQNQMEKLKFSTEQQFNRKQQPSAPRLYYTRPLQDSRKSVYSGLSVGADLQPRRKFAAVKQLPTMPRCEVISQRGVLNRNEGDYIKSQAKQQRQRLLVEQSSQGNRKKEEVGIKVEESIRRQQHVPFQTSKQSKHYSKDQVISVLAKLKLFEIDSLSIIIEQYQRSLKSQSVLNQKNVLGQSYTTLHSLLSLSIQ